MSASSLDKITDVRNAARPNSARATGTRSAGGNSLACDNLAGWPTASKVHFVTYQIDSDSNPVTGTQLDCTGIVSGNTIGSFVVKDGTDTGNSVNDVVEMLPTAAWGQDLADALTNQHTRTGAHSGITNTGGISTDTFTSSGNATVNGTATHSGATVLTGAVSGAGYDAKTQANSYKFLATPAASGTPGPAASIIKFTSSFDTGSNYSASTGLFTAPIAGFYMVSAGVQINTSNGGNNLGSIYLYKNGSNFNILASHSVGAISGTQTDAGSILMQLVANDTLAIWASNSISTSYSGGYFSVYLVSAT